MHAYTGTPHDVDIDTIYNYYHISPGGQSNNKDSISYYHKKTVIRAELTET